MSLHVVYVRCYDVHSLMPDHLPGIHFHIRQLHLLINDVSVEVDCSSCILETFWLNVLHISSYVAYVLTHFT